MQKPRRKQVRDETFKLFEQEGLTGWKVRFNPRLSRALGRCIPSRKTIEYQTRYIEQNDWDEIIDTIRHEVAHALNPRDGHGYAWRRDCVRLGGNGNRTSSTANLTLKFTGTCPGCDRKIQRDRRNKQACGKCCNEHAGGLFSPRFAFVWTRNA